MKRSTRHLSISRSVLWNTSPRLVVVVASLPRRKTDVGGSTLLGSLLLHRVTERSDKGSRGVPYLGLVGAYLKHCF